MITGVDISRSFNIDPNENKEHVMEMKIAVEIVTRKSNFAKTRKLLLLLLSLELDEMKKNACDQSQQTNLRFTTSLACESYRAGSSTVRR